MRELNSLRGVIKILKYITPVAKVIYLLAAFMLAVEREGEGEEKKNEVVEAAQEAIDNLNLPEWLKELLGNSKMLSILINLLHKVLERNDLLL